MKRRNYGIYVLLGLSVLLALLSAFVTYFNTREKEQSMHSVIRRYKSIGASINLLSLLKDMETGERGYIISGDSDFLEPYEGAKQKISGAIDTLNRLVYDDVQQSNLINGKIIAAIRKKSEDLENVIRLASTSGTENAATRIKTKIGKAYMDTLRVLVQDLIQREETLLEIQNKKLEQNTRIEDSVRFIAFTLIALTSLAAIGRLLKKRNRIDQLVKSLQSANEGLENKVRERTKELVAANEAKDHFLGVASHDLKVPLSGVLGLIELMNLENKDRPEREVEYLNYMQDSCKNMQGLISNLLDINRIETGANTINLKEVDLGNLLIKLEREFAISARRKNVELVIYRTEGKVQTDSDALSCILENLTSNAIKFSPRGKTVQLKSSKVNSNICFEIIDQGPGISPEEMPRLFGKFQKLSNKPTGGEGSTGLGLAIVKELVSSLRGEINVKSKIGEGTTFTFSIPC